MKEILGLIFAYSSFPRLGELVSPRTAASLPFGGRYRAIDFCLSNMVNAGISDVGVIMRDSYQSLMDHLGGGKDWDLSRKNGGLFLLPPQSYGGNAYSRGESFVAKLDALSGVYKYITASSAEYVLLADGDCITNIRVNDVLAAHEKSGADITVVCSRMPIGEAEHSIYFTLDGSERIRGVIANAETPQDNESLGMFLMKKTLLEELIKAGREGDLVHFERGILRQRLDTLNMRPYFHPGYVARLHTVADYYRHNMALLNERVRDQLLDRSNPVRARIRDAAPTYYSDTARVSGSLIASGCRIEGTVENSILFRNVHVAPGAVVRNCIVMQDGRICQNAQLDTVVLDKRVTVRAARVLTGSPASPYIIGKGSVV